jgi:hypothetical protein
VIDDESLVKTRTNTCLSYTSAVPSYFYDLGLGAINQLKTKGYSLMTRGNEATRPRRDL